MKRTKWLIGLYIGFILSVPTQKVDAKVIHEIVHEQTITRGVIHTEKEVLTSSGWQDINILSIDLSDDNVSLGVLESSTLGEKDTITNFANKEGAVAAINADFFDMGSTLSPGFGPVIEDGQVQHAYNNEYGTLGPAKNMATFVLDDQNNPMMDFYSIEFKATTEGQYLFDINSYNKWVNSIARPQIIDNTYYSDNSQIVSKYAETGAYTVIIEEGIIQKVSQKNEIIQIDDNQMALIMNEATLIAHSMYLIEGRSIEVHQELVLNQQVVESVENLQMSVGGGGLIMKNGQAYTGETHQVSGDKKEPRTIIATTYENHELLMITIDGRGSSIGANHNDLISILTDLNVKDAMYLDGGGSTTMSVRDEGDMDTTLQNQPSGIIERKVTNGVGVFTTKEEGTLEKLMITPSTDRTFVGRGITLNLQGIDEYGNPITTIDETIEMSVAGVSGRFEGMTFIPETEGTALVVVSVGDITNAIEIEISTPKAIEVEPAIVQVDVNASKQVKLYGIDQEGYRMPLLAEDITWMSPVGAVTASGDLITANAEEMTTLVATYKELSVEVPVVAGEIVSRIESFEENAATWSGTGTTVDGLVETTSDVKYHGNQSLKMTYTFETDNNRQIAYANFNQPIHISEDAKSINMWLNAEAQGDAVKIQVEDANGKTHYLEVLDELDFTGWKYVSIPLQEEMTLPLKVTKLYTYSNTNAQKRTSTLYIDHVSITRGTRNASVAKTEYTFDPMYKKSLQEPVNDQYMIKVTGPTAEPTVSQEIINQITQNLNTHADVVIKASQSNANLTINTPLTYQGQFGQGTFGSMDFIFIGTDKGSLRTHAESEWTSFKQALEYSEANHILLVMEHHPLKQFTDQREGQAFHDYLVDYREKTGKDIFVITTGGDEKEVEIEQGIRYIRLNGLNTKDGTLDTAEYLTFKVVNDDIYYTFEPML